MFLWMKVTLHLEKKYRPLKSQSFNMQLYHALFFSTHSHKSTHHPAQNAYIAENCDQMQLIQYSINHRGYIAVSDT